MSTIRQFTAEHRRTGVQTARSSPNKIVVGSNPANLNKKFERYAKVLLFKKTLLLF